MGMFTHQVVHGIHPTRLFLSTTLRIKHFPKLNSFCMFLVKPNQLSSKHFLDYRAGRGMLPRPHSFNVLQYCKHQ